ncbi:MAG TPA: GntR family transcriptional regulator [Vicinamibacterales bacterium]|nr:GntR family transcriptional regulator [Vicinamibacterales bacterium]
MFLELDPSNGRAIYLQIVDEVCRQAALGILRPDDPLPAVRQLAAELKVNANTVQHAYRELLRDGVVYVKRGQGTFVASPRAGKGELSKQRQAALARQIAQRALRDAYRHGLVASDLVTALTEIAASPHA